MQPSEDDTQLRRRLVAVAFADVADFSRMMGEDEERTTLEVKKRLRLFSEVIRDYSGEVVGHEGDNAFMIFESAVDAVKFSVEMQRKLDGLNEGLDQNLQVNFRFGIHVGEILLRGEDFSGECINIAARIEAFAQPGRICISGTVFDQVSRRLTFGYEYLGAQDFKNIADKVDVFQVHENPTAAAMTPGLRSMLGEAQLEQAAIDLSIVVLPFKFQGPDQADRWFADGLTEDVTTSLSRFSQFFVIARGSANLCSDRGSSPKQAAHELGVRYAVEGTVRKVGPRIRITLQLLDARQDRAIWGEQYNRDVEDLFDLQDEITQIIVSATAAKIEVSERERLRVVPPANLAAYGFVLQGQQHIIRYTRKEVGLARQLYNHALESDPRYARALAAKSRTFNLDWRYDWAERPERALDDALVLAQDAIGFDAQDARGFGELGFAHLYRKEHEAALTAYERALSLNPNDADLMSDMGDALVHSGRSEEAIQLLEKAMRLNPFYPDQYLWHLGGAYFHLKRYQDAAHTVQGMQNPTEGRRILAASYALMGESEKACAEAELIRQAHPNFTVDHWASVQPDLHEEDVHHFVEGLKRAGL